MFLLQARWMMHVQQEQVQLSKSELPEKLEKDSGNILQKGTTRPHQQDNKRKFGQQRLILIGFEGTTKTHDLGFS